jgi:hypothetical protein
MSTQDKPLLQPAPWHARVWAALAAGVFAAALTFLLFGVMPTSDAPSSIIDRISSAVTAIPSVAKSVLFPGKLLAPTTHWTGLDPTIVEYAIRYALLLCLAFGIGHAAHRRARLTQASRLNATFISGATYADGRDAKEKADSLLADDRRVSGDGIAVSPDLRLPRNREIQSMLVIGRPRYGKSTAMRFMLNGILARPRDKLIVYDSKGDVTAEWPNKQVILLAPHDTRSWGWAVGRDILGEAGARELAATLIKVSDRESNWTLGGQEILIAVIRSLQATRGTAWSWQDLGDLLDLPDPALRQLAYDYHRPALRYLTLDPETGEFDRTASSYLSTAMAPVQRIVRPLAEAWSGLAPKYQISLREWLLDEKPSRRTIIIQRAAHLPALSTVWITAVLEMMARYCVGPALVDSVERRLWFVLDEFSTVPKIECISDLLAQGPSKGVCCILACQNLELVEKEYGSTLTKSIIQNTDIQMLFRLNPGPTVEYLTQTAIPKTELRRYRSSTTSKAKGEGAASDDRPETLCLVTPHAIATLERGEAFVVVEGSILKLRWPKSNWIIHRPQMIEAAWVSQQSAAPVA